MDILNIVESRLIFLPKRRVYSAHILITSLIDKLFKININLREFCNFV